MNSECFNILIKDKLFLSFLKHQVQGVFDNFDCNHHDLSPDTICFICIKNFITTSSYKDYFEGLYNWFKQVNFQLCIRDQYFYFNSCNNKNDNKNDSNSNQINDNKNDSNSNQINDDKNDSNSNNNTFYPQDIFECFETICYHLKPNEARYFCSSWLDGMYSEQIGMLSGYNITILDIFTNLCVEEHFETLKWFYQGIKPYFRLSRSEQQRLFNNIYHQKTKKNTKIHEILSWLFSIKIFNQLNVHDKNEEAFSVACSKGNLELIKWLLNYKNSNQINTYNGVNVHANNESAFRLACDYGQTEVVELLLSLEGQREIDINVLQEDGFKSACYGRHIEIIRLLLNLKGKRRVNVHINEESIFQYVCSKGNIQIAQLLFDYLETHQEFISMETYEIIFLKACENEYVDFIQLLLKNKYYQANNCGIIFRYKHLLKLKFIYEKGLNIAKSRDNKKLIQILEDLLINTK